jgi:hypothetical protein
MQVQEQGQHTLQAGASSAQGGTNQQPVQLQGAAVGVSAAMAALLAPLTARAPAASGVPAAGQVAASAGSNHAADGPPAGEDVLPGAAPHTANAVSSPAATTVAAPDAEQGTPFGTADDAAFALQISVSQQLENLLEEQQQRQEYEPGLDQVAEEGEEEQDVTEATDGTQSTQATAVTEVNTQVRSSGVQFCNMSPLQCSSSVCVPVGPGCAVLATKQSLASCCIAAALSTVQHPVDRRDGARVEALLSKHQQAVMNETACALAAAGDVPDGICHRPRGPATPAAWRQPPPG